VLSDNDEESLYACCCTQKVTAKGCHRYSILAITSGVRRIFPRGSNVSSQSCDVTNQL